MEPVSTTALSVKGGLILLPIVTSIYKAMTRGEAAATTDDSGLLSDLGGYLLDLAKGVASSEADRRIALLQGQTHILGNEHIAKFTGLVLRQSIERFAAQPAYQDLRKDLHALAAKVESDWPTLIAQGAPDAAGLDGQTFVQRLHDSLVNDTPVPPLDPAFVQVWLMSVSRQHGLTLHVQTEVLGKLSASLTSQLLADLATGIVSSDPTAVTAWKKTILRSLADLREGQGQILLSIEDLKSILAGHQHDLMQSILGLCAGQEEIVELIRRALSGLTNNTKILWNMPTRAGRFFGRQGQVQEILALWQQHRCLAITGMGGLGKTALAGEVLARLAPSASEVITASRRLLLHDFYRQPSHLSALDVLLRQAKPEPDTINVSDNLSPEERKREIIKQMESQLATELNQPDTYLYLEGCEKAEDLSTLLGLTGNAKVLLTIRGQTAPHRTQGWSLPPLKLADAAALIAHLAGQDPQDVPASHHDLARFLGGHALACRLAGNLLARKTRTATGLLAELNKAGLSRLGTAQHEHESVDWLLRQTALALEAENPGSIRVWYVLALGALSPLPLSLLAAMLGMDNDTLLPLLEALQDQGIVLTDTVPPESGPEPEPAAHLAHALIQTFALRDLPTLLSQGQNLDPGENYTAWRETWRAYFIRCHENRGMIGGYLRLEALLPQFETLLQRMEETEPPDSSDHAIVLSSLALLHQHSSRFLMAEQLMRRGVGIFEAIYEENHPHFTSALNNLANLLQHINQLAEAETLMRRVLAIGEANYGPDHPEVAIRLNNLSTLLFTTNRLAEAEPLIRRVVSINEKAYGQDHLKEAIGLNNLASLFETTNRLAEAEPLMRRVVSILEEAHGQNHPDVSTALNNLAQLFQKTNRLADAEPLMWRALAIDETNYGPDHPEVATALTILAGLLQETDRLAEAEALFRRALTIDEASYRHDHPNISKRLNNLALLLKDTNRLGEAEPLIRRALEINEANYGMNHPDVATALNNLALILQATNRMTEAEPLIRRALEINEASYGPDHPSVARDLNNLAQLLQATGRLAEAELIYQKALTIGEACYGPDHPAVARVLNNLGALFYAANRPAEAEPLLQRALAIEEASYGPKHSTIARHLNNLALLLKDTNRLGEAEPLIRRALEINEANYGMNHPDVATALNNLALILQATNQMTEAEPLYRRALGILLRFQVSTGHAHPLGDTFTRNYVALLLEMGLAEGEILEKLRGIAEKMAVEWGGGE